MKTAWVGSLLCVGVGAFSGLQSHPYLFRSAATTSLKAASHQPSEEGDGSEKPPLAETSFLSHMMLKVPSVDDTAAYWVEKGGTIKTSKAQETTGEANGASPPRLLSAFVELGIAMKKQEEESPVCFALELVTSKKDKESFTIGNSISYLGVSMLLQFQNNL